eukprot:4747254-Amphidinium_carterae.1
MQQRRLQRKFTQEDSEDTEDDMKGQPCFMHALRYGATVCIPRLRPFRTVEMPCFSSSSSQ